MLNDSNKQQLLSWYYQGYNFYKSSLILFNNESQWTVFPMFTLQAFSVECSLKALILSTDDDFPYSHDLLKLFQSLPSTLKEEIGNSFNAKFSENFEDTLSKISKDFMDSRYFFEKSRVTFWASHLASVAEFLLDYVKNHGESIIRNDYHNSQDL